MSRLVAREFGSERFAWIPESRTFVAGVSSFRGIGFSGPIWEGSCDEGFAMKSSRTGQKILCIWTGDKRDRENDLLYHRLLCYDLRGEPLSGPLAGAEVHITNN